jgi:hypothetical protein
VLRSRTTPLTRIAGCANTAVASAKMAETQAGKSHDFVIERNMLASSCE